MTETKHKNPLSAVPLIALLVACATPDGDNTPVPNIPNDGPISQSTESTLYAVNEDYNLDLVEYTVKSGDRLSNIAEDITGQSSNWREIATFNSIDDPRRLQAGTVLAIPTELIIGYEQTGVIGYEQAEVIGYEQTGDVLVSQSEQIIPPPEAQSSSLAVRRNEPVEIAPVVVTPINTNRDFELNPIDPSKATSTKSYRGAGTQIKVVGTYYPKGIYTEPAAYSKLIKRVAPGTLFVLDSKVNDWYKIILSDGSGYIRTSDAAIIDKSE